MTPGGGRLLAALGVNDGDRGVPGGIGLVQPGGGRLCCLQRGSGGLCPGGHDLLVRGVQVS